MRSRASFGACLIGAALVIAGCSGHRTTGSRPTRNCSVDQVREAFAKRGVPLLVAAMETSGKTPLLGDLRSELTWPTTIDVMVFRTATDARGLFGPNPDRFAHEGSIRMVYRLNVVALYQRTAPARVKEAVRAVVVRWGCRRSSLHP